MAYPYFFRGILFSLFAYLIGFTISVKAQAPVFKEYELIRYNDQIQVNKVFQSPNGLLWFATSEGLFQFDGIENIQFTESESLSTTPVSSLAYDSTAGIFWLGHPNGAISKGKPGQWETFMPPEGVPASPISDILIQDSLVWFATQGEGVYYYRNNRLYIISTDEGLPDNYVYDLELDPQGRVWVGTDGGIGIISFNEAGKASVQIIEYAQGLPDNIVKKLIYKGDNQVWIGMHDSGLARISIQDFKVTHFTPDWGLGSINDLVFSENTLWIGTDRRGLVAYSLMKDQNIRIFNRSNGLNQLRIKSLLEDQEGNLWIGSTSGVVKSPGKQVEFIQKSEQLDNFNVQSILADTFGDIWFSTSSGLFRLSQQAATYGIIEKHLEGTRFQNLSFISMYQDPFGDLWLGTYGDGLLWYSPKTKKSSIITESNGLVNGNILSITGTGNQLWLATLGGAAVATIQPNAGQLNFQNFTEMEGLSSNFIYKVFIDSQQRIWFATDGKGVSMYQNGRFTNYNQTNGLPSGIIYSITEDQSGNLWFSTSDKGISRFDGKNFLNVGSKEGLRDLMINSLVVDSKGNILVFNRLGLDLLNPKSLKFSYLSEEVGLGRIENNLNAYSHDRNGNSWFGTAQGIVKYSPRASIYQDRAKVVLREVQIFNKAINAEAQKKFSYHQNNFTFEFAGLWYTAPEKVKYQVKLENFDLDWIAIENRRFTYSSLPPGSYTFQVRASADQDFESAPIAQYSFVITPPFWKTIWFYIATVIIGIFGFMAFVRARERNLRQTQRILENKVEVRTQEIKAQNEELEAQRDQINEKNQKLELAFNEIHKKNESITSSITYAKRIQRAILPLEDKMVPVLPEHFILYKPRDIVSGDFYWFSNKGNRVYIAAVDCTGHGVPGAFMSLIGSSLLNEIVDNNEHIAPVTILEYLNQGVIRMLKQEELTDERLKSRDGMDISLLCIDRQRKIIEYAGAKRPLFKIENGELEEFKGSRSSIGGQAIFNTEVDFFQHEIPLREGQNYYFFTDGYPDQFSGHNATKFLTKNFKELLSKHHQEPTEIQVQKLDEKFVAWQGNAHQTDDVLVIGLKITTEWLQK